MPPDPPRGFSRLRRSQFSPPYQTYLPPPMDYGPLQRPFYIYFYISICISTLPTQHTAFYVSLWRRAHAQDVRRYFLYRQYTNLFIFWFVSQHCLRSTLHFMFLSDEETTLKTFDFAFYFGSTPTFYMSWFFSQLIRRTLRLFHNF